MGSGSVLVISQEIVTGSVVDCDVVGSAVVAGAKVVARVVIGIETVVSSPNPILIKQAKWIPFIIFDFLFES